MRKFHFFFQIEKRWNEMEKKCQKARSSSPSGPSPPELRHDTVKGAFRDQINLLYDLYKIANDYVDFGRFPVSSVNEWSKRVQVKICLKIKLFL